MDSVMAKRKKKDAEELMRKKEKKRMQERSKKKLQQREMKWKDQERRQEEIGNPQAMDPIFDEILQGSPISPLPLLPEGSSSDRPLQPSGPGWGYHHHP